MRGEARKQKPIKWWGVYSPAGHYVAASPLWSRKGARERAKSCEGAYVVQVTFEREGASDGR